MTTALCITGAMIAAVLALLAWGVCRAAGRDSRYVVLPQDVPDGNEEYLS